MSAKKPLPVGTLIDPQVNDVTPLTWEEASNRIDAARWFWFTTVHPSGRPHTRPVLAVWRGDSCTPPPAGRRRKVTTSNATRGVPSLS